MFDLYEGTRAFERPYRSPACLPPTETPIRSEGKLIATIIYDFKNGTERIVYARDLERKTEQ
jgi:hypothetical protein